MKQAVAQLNIQMYIKQGWLMELNTFKVSTEVTLDQVILKRLQDSSLYSSLCCLFFLAVSHHNHSLAISLNLMSVCWSWSQCIGVCSLVLQTEQLNLSNDEYRYLLATGIGTGIGTGMMLIVVVRETWNSDSKVLDVFFYI